MRTAYHTAGILLLSALIVPGRLAQGQPRTSPALATSAEAVQYVHEQWTVVDGLPVNNLNDLVQTRDGYLWIATWDGLVRFDGVRFTTFNVGNTATLLSNRVVDLYLGRGGELWGVQVHPGALLRVEDGQVVGTRKTFWFGGRAEILGEDEAGQLWIRSGWSGVAVYHTYKGQHFVRVPEGGVPASIAALAVPLPPSPWDIEDQQHVTYAGDRLFTTPSPISGSVEDQEGSFWVATEQDGLHRFRPAPIVTLGVAGGERRVGVTAVSEDPSGTVWAKPSDDAGSYRLVNDAFVHVPDTAYYAWLRAERTPDMPSICRQDHGGIHRDRRGAIWSNTYNEGVCRLQDGSWTYFGSDVGFAGRVHAIHESHEGALWFLTFVGQILRYRDGRFQILTTDEGFAAENLRGFHQDADGVIWVGSYGGGLHRIDLPEEADLSQARITVLGTREGLYDDVIHAILEDDQERLWMSTNRGLFWVRRAELNALARGEIDRVRSVFYDERDGMLDREANGGMHLPGLKARDGRLYFPTQDGVVMVDPRRVGTNAVPPPVVIEQVVAGDTTFLPRDGAARLAAAQRDFEVTYTGLSFVAPEQMRFQYRLDGYTDTWREVSRRTAFYTGVPPGNYTFRVRAMNKDGLWSEEDAMLTLSVVPYFYETAWFFALCGLALLLLGWAGYRARTRQLRHRQQALEALVAERTEALRAEKGRTEAQNALLATQAEQLRALDAAKSHFFANITHEFRTPLTLILGPLKSALAGGYGPAAEPLREAHRMMLRNGQRLLRLINQILDLAKVEAGRLALQAEVQDLGAFVAHEVRAFAPLAERQGLRLTCEVPEAPVVAAFDLEQLEKVLLNLLSNALKFTEPGGAVDVTLRRAGQEAEIAVRDTGVGIAPEKLPHLFERFFQADDSATRTHEGTGIGLALAKEIMELHGGAIAVESAPGVGSTFTIRLPLAQDVPVSVGEAGDERTGPKERMPGDPLLQDEELSFNGAGTGSTEDLKEEEDRTTVLVVDDNADVRAFVRSILEPSYRVLEAADGADGLDTAKAALPDLVVCDVMMPRLDGFAFSRALKEDAATDCIPVILLTARADTEDEVEGLEAGADDYVTKPFEAEVLRARVAGLIASRQLLRARFSGGDLPAEPAPPARSPFEQHLREILEAHLSDPDFNPEALADGAALSYDQLYRRLREEQDETPSQFIRRVRVERAAHLLEEQAGTVSEVAYAVGFNSLSYFNRSFHEHFACAPSAYA